MTSAKKITLQVIALTTLAVAACAALEYAARLEDARWRIEERNWERYRPRSLRVDERIRVMDDGTQVVVSAADWAGAGSASR